MCCWLFCEALAPPPFRGKLQPQPHPQTHTSHPHKPEPQARGRALLNLRLSEAEGGLLGRTLLTLVPNKGFGSGPPAPLPQHKLSPHDVVALRPNSQPPGAGGAPLCGGLVYRVRESAIVVAVDEVPEDGLEQPLRLEKLANEVRAARGAGARPLARRFPLLAGVRLFWAPKQAALLPGPGAWWSG